MPEVLLLEMERVALLVYARADRTGNKFGETTSEASGKDAIVTTSIHEHNLYETYCAIITSSVNM